eukprot:1109404-Pleurochrysis_carterae.AAC.2
MRKRAMMHTAPYHREIRQYCDTCGQCSVLLRTSLQLCLPQYNYCCSLHIHTILGFGMRAKMHGKESKVSLEPLSRKASEPNLTLQRRAAAPAGARRVTSSDRAKPSARHLKRGCRLHFLHAHTVHSSHLMHSVCNHLGKKACGILNSEASIKDCCQTEGALELTKPV